MTPLSEIQPGPLLQRMADDLEKLIAARGLRNPVVVGVHTGGEWIAARLHETLGVETPLSTLDINFYRDDFSRIGLHPRVRPSAIRSEINNNPVILVDDVLHTGRTICAALNELADYGRASSVVLAVLLDRNGREMPIHPDVRGASVALEADQQIKLRGPEPLSIEILKPG